MKLIIKDPKSRRNDVQIWQNTVVNCLAAFIKACKQKKHFGTKLPHVASKSLKYEMTKNEKLTMIGLNKAP